MNIKQQLDMQARYSAQAIGEAEMLSQDSGQFTPEAIDAMSKADLHDLAQGHGLKFPKGTSINGKRGMVKAAIFTGL